MQSDPEIFQYFSKNEKNHENSSDIILKSHIRILNTCDHLALPFTITTTF